MPVFGQIMRLLVAFHESHSLAIGSCSNGSGALLADMLVLVEGGSSDAVALALQLYVRHRNRTHG